MTKICVFDCHSYLWIFTSLAAYPQKCTHCQSNYWKTPRPKQLDEMACLEAARNHQCENELLNAPIEGSQTPNRID